MRHISLVLLIWSQTHHWQGKNWEESERHGEQYALLYACLYVLSYALIQSYKNGNQSIDFIVFSSFYNKCGGEIRFILQYFQFIQTLIVWNEFGNRERGKCRKAVGPVFVPTLGWCICAGGCVTHWTSVRYIKVSWLHVYFRILCIFRQDKIRLEPNLCSVDFSMYILLGQKK